MQVQQSIIHGEVLRQLAGVTAQWVVHFALVLLIVRLVSYIHYRVSENSLGDLLSGIKRAFNHEDKKVPTIPVNGKLKVVTLLLIALSAGYLLGFSINQSYVSGKITLITTVGRVTHFYNLVLYVFESMLLMVAMVVISSEASLIERFGVNSKKARRAKALSDIVVRSAGILALILAFVLPLVALIACYTTIK